jgi:hypothetical protein
LSLSCASEPQCPPHFERARNHSQHKWAKMQAAAFKTSLPRAGVFGGSRVAVGPQRAQLLAPTISRRGTVQVVAAEEQKKKRTPQPEKRAELALEQRSRNRSRKSAIATRTKKVCAIRGPVGAVIIACVSLHVSCLFNCCWMYEWGLPCTPFTAATTHSSSAAANHHALLGAHPWPSNQQFDPQWICSYCIALRSNGWQTLANNMPWRAAAAAVLCSSCIQARL